MDLKSMKLPVRDKSAEEKMYPTMAGGDEQQYPYCLCITLGDQQIDALGMTTLPKVGGTIALEANGTISAVSENQTKGGSQRSVSIQITALGLDNDADD